jgi:hypothetical protein
MRAARRAALRVIGIALLAVPSALTGQAAPKIFLLPGVGEGPSNWSSTISTLTGSGLTLGTIYAPALSTGDHLATQTSYLLSAYPTMDTTSIMIGHSNGGIVARLASASRAVLGTATLASPNGGVAALWNADDLNEFGSDMLWDLSVTLDDFFLGGDLGILDEDVLVYEELFTDLAVALEYYIEDSYTAIGTDAATDVYPFSTFLGTLNDSTQFNAENSHTGTSVGVTMAAEAYYYAGPLRLATDAGGAYGISLAINTAAAAMLIGADDILGEYPLTAEQLAEAADLQELADLLWLVEPAWCAGITRLETTHPWLFTCDDNDAFLGVTFQERPGRTNLSWTDTKAHSAETEEGSRIAGLLSGTFHVP